MRICLLLAAAALLSAHDGKIDPERIVTLDRQTLAVPDFAASGYVLDIGGGGEGVIGQLKPNQVVAIDLSKRELEGAPAGPLKIVMDATDLKFLDGSFETATAFFSLMYMPPEAKDKALREVRRVLKPGGRLLIWDVNVPAQTDPKKDIVVFPFTFELPDRQVRTGYGTLMRPFARDLAWHLPAMEAAGFRIVRKHEQGETFFVELRKE